MANRRVQAMTDLRTIIQPMTPKTHAMLTLSYFAKASGRTDTDALKEDLMALCEGEDACLEPWAIYDDPYGNEHSIEDEDFAEYLETGLLVCPQTGVIVENPEERLSIYWARKEDPVPEPR